MPLLVFLALLLAPAGRLDAQSRNLDIYWIDVEGGAATLLVSPSGESLLIDTGWTVDDRDAQRIHAAAQQAGLKKIDYLVISHFHADHVGGLAALSKLIPIGRFFDRGDAIEKENQQWLDSYKTASAGKRTIVRPGDTIPLKGLQALVVSSDERVLSNPVRGGGSNPLCANAERKAPAGPENARGVGVLFTYGKFTFLNLIDLDWAKEMELACPINKLGQMTLYQTGRRRLATIPGIEGIWLGHRSLLDSDPSHNTAEDMIANLEDTNDCKGNWIKASVARDGKFTVTNGRNGFSKTYAAR
jgi:competence protein ComEC